MIEGQEDVTWPQWQALGEPAGLLQLLERHNRDGAQIADRLGVPHLRLPSAVPGSPFEVVSVVSVPGWRELALWWADRRVLVVSEAIGTGPMFRPSGGATAGVHLFLRGLTPSALRRFEPEHLLVGHGRNVHEGATEALRTAYARRLRDLPRVLKRLPSAVRG